MFDGSAKEGGPSINESLYTGPCLLTCIYSTLLRFRMFKIGLISDIRQAFLNVGICNEHKDLLRFLWYDDKNNMLIIYRFLRVVFGITSSPFLLNTTVIKHMENYSDTFKELTKKFLRDLYVDDTTVGVNTVNKGIQFYNFIKEAMKKGENDSSQDYEHIKQQLDLFIDEHNILRLKGRFENSLLEYAEKYPIILRSYSHFTKIIVLAAHERVKHVRLGTLNELRSRFWIRKVRQVVKKYIKDCVKCKRVLAKTLHGPGPPNLTIFRVATHKFAFTNIGLDYAGPL